MYQLKQGSTVIQRAPTVMELQRIAANLNINTYSVFNGLVLVYQIKGIK